MRNSRALVAAGAVVAALGLAAPAAVSWDDGSGQRQNNNSDFRGDPGNNGGFGGNGNNDIDGFGGDGNNNGGFGGNGNDGFHGGNDGFGGNGDNNDGFGGFGNENEGFRGDRDDNGGFGGNGNNNDGFGGLGNNNDGFRGDGNNGAFGGLGNNFGASPRNIVVRPNIIARGGQLTITVDGCPGGGTAASAAFLRARLTPIRGGSQTARGTAIVNANARPGTYDITVDCSGRTLIRPAAFTVLGGVRGGLGGSSSSGATPTDMAIGGGLVAAAAIGGGVVWVRRRAEKRA